MTRLDRITELLARRAARDLSQRSLLGRLGTFAGFAGKVPDMRGNLARFLQVPGGRDYIVRVPGVSTARMDNDAVADLLNWLLPEMSTEPLRDFRPYTPEEVGRLRRNWLNRPAETRSELIRAIESANAAPGNPPP